MRKKTVFQSLVRNGFKPFPTLGTLFHRLVIVLTILIFILFFNWQVLAVGTSFTYQGRLTDGSSPVNVPQDFRFKIFNAETSGTQIGSTIMIENVPVTNGLFVVELDFGSNVFTGYSRWLEIGVRPGTSTGSYTLLTPRQKINPTPYSIMSRSSEALKLPYEGTVDSPTNPAFTIINTTGNYAIHGRASNTGVGYNYGGHFTAHREQGVGVLGMSSGVYGIGVYGEGEGDYGYGVYGYADGTYGAGVNAYSVYGNSIYIPYAGKNGVYIQNAGECGVYVNSATLDGVRVVSANWSGVYVESSGYDALRVGSAGQDGLRFFQNITRDYIRAGSDADLDFRVLNTGEVQSDVGFNTPAADFAEMIEVEGDITQYEPGDVLVISDKQNRAVTLSSKPYSSAIIGVYSTAPGFVGGKPVSDNKTTNKVPVAIMGIVPCKVSAENGSIARGDLLVTSSTKGYAMRTDNPKSGTLLGKAMESLDKNKGTILVLVTLQ